jgi:hypothetical protein
MRIARQKIMRGECDLQSKVFVCTVEKTNQLQAGKIVKSACSKHLLGTCGMIVIGGVIY